MDTGRRDGRDSVVFVAFERDGPSGRICSLANSSFASAEGERHRCAETGRRTALSGPSSSDEASSFAPDRSFEVARCNSSRGDHS